MGHKGSEGGAEHCQLSSPIADLLPEVYRFHMQHLVTYTSTEERICKAAKQDVPE